LIPNAFIARLDGSMADKVVLISRTNRFWQVKLSQRKNVVFFQNGWKRFVKANSVEHGDFLVFRYDGNDVFDGRLYGISGLEKEPVKEDEERNGDVEVMDDE
ncbi:B3 domain-containing protein, partial [Cephalotus follicularis]